MSKNEIKVNEENELMVQDGPIIGFDGEDLSDLIIPRMKIVQSLSPERKAKEADEGDIIDSLLKTKLTDKNFVPVYMYKNKIDWIPRDDGGGIRCQARDNINGIESDGTALDCNTCGKFRWDNTKTGKEAQPTCTEYFNFVGFIEGETMPIVASFGKTNYKQGKDLYTMAKVQRQNMFNFKYKLTAVEKSANGNDWFIIVPKPAGPTTEEDRVVALDMFHSFSGTDLNVDMGDEAGETQQGPDGIKGKKSEY